MSKILALLALLLLVGCGSPVPSSGAVATPLAETAPLPPAMIEPDVALLDLAGHKHRPFSDPDVRAVALVFVLPDCPIANSYLPTLNRLHDAYQPRGVRLFLVHADPKITRAEAGRHAAEYEIRPPVILDPHHDWVRRAAATKTPEAVVYSQQRQVLYRGRIDDQYVGLGKRRTEVTSHDLADALDAILAGQPVPRPNTEPVGCHIPALSNGD
jgi:hypothetical protein